MCSYRIRAVDGSDEDIADHLRDLHKLTFTYDVMPDFDVGSWWMAYHDKLPVAFAGYVTSTHELNAAYFARVGVVEKHTGNGLQCKLMRALESDARYNGFDLLVSDTTSNPASANNFIKRKWRIYEPQYPWASLTSIYWRKKL